MLSLFWNSCSLFLPYIFPYKFFIDLVRLTSIFEAYARMEGWPLTLRSCCCDCGGCKHSHRCSKRKEASFCLCFSLAHAISQSRGKLDSWTLPLELLCVSLLVSLYICRGRNKTLQGVYCYCFTYKITQQESMYYLDGISWYKNILF